MEAIVLADDELKRLEGRFGPAVRRMGPWNTDGFFGYSSIPLVAVEKAIESLEDRNLEAALSHLKHTPEPAKAFIELLDGSGPALIDRIVAAYKDCWPCPS